MLLFNIEVYCNLSKSHFINDIKKHTTALYLYPQRMLHTSENYGKAVKLSNCKSVKLSGIDPSIYNVKCLLSCKTFYTHSYIIIIKYAEMKMQNFVTPFVAVLKICLVGGSRCRVTLVNVMEYDKLLFPGQEHIKMGLGFIFCRIP